MRSAENEILLAIKTVRLEEKTATFHFITYDPMVHQDETVEEFAKRYCTIEAGINQLPKDNVNVAAQPEAVAVSEYKQFIETTTPPEQLGHGVYALEFHLASTRYVKVPSNLPVDFSRPIQVICERMAFTNPDPIKF